MSPFMIQKYLQRDSYNPPAHLCNCNIMIPTFLQPVLSNPLHLLIFDFFFFFIFACQLCFPSTNFTRMASRHFDSFYVLPVSAYVFNSPINKPTVDSSLFISNKEMDYMAI